MTFLAFIGALLVGLTLRLMGSGGAILTVPLLVLLLHRPEKLAIAESLAIILLISLGGALSAAMRHQVHWKSLLFFGLPGMLGACLGAHFSFFLSGTFQLFLFSLLMFVVAGIIFLTPTLSTQPPLSKGASSPLPLPPILDTSSILSTMGRGFLIGGLTGVIGIGGGFLIVPALLFFNYLPMSMAVGTSLAIIFLNALIGSIMQFYYLQEAHLEMNIEVIVLFSLAGIGGSLLGNAYVQSASEQRLKQIFGMGVLVIGLYLFFSTLHAHFFT